MSAVADALLRTFAYQDGLVLTVAAALAEKDGPSASQGQESSHPSLGYRRAAEQALLTVHDAGDATEVRAILDGLRESNTLLARSLSSAAWDNYEQVATAAAEALVFMPPSPGFDDWSEAALVGAAATIMLPRLPPLTSDSELLRRPIVAEALLRLGLRERGQATALGRAMAFTQPMLGLAGSYAAPLLHLAQDTSLTPRAVVAEMDRPLNVLASGQAHRSYFKAASAILRHIFDDPNVSRQPKAVIDIGCGDGSLLREVDAFVRAHTRRGAELAQYPLLLIGVDVDPRALDVARDRLKDHHAVILLGDIGQPDAVVDAVRQQTELGPDDVLHVRAFVDHNRTLPNPVGEEPAGAGQVFIHPDGHVVPQAQVARDWVAHMQAWRKACGSHGIMLFEGHTLDPAQRSVRRGSTHATAFAFYHSLSAQCPIPHAQFLETLREAGFGVDKRSSRFPATGHATASLSWIKPRT